MKKKTEKKRKRSDDNSPFKPRGLYSIDALKHQSKLDLADMQILGVDPGKSNLLAIVDIDSKKQGRRNKLKRLQYTRQQRAFETNERKFAVLQKAEKPDTVVSAEKELSNNNSRSSHLHDDSQSTQHKGLLSYFSTRRKWFETEFTFYSKRIYRERQWYAFRLRQKSLTKLVKNIKKMKDPRKTLVLAYGAWGGVAGRPGMPCNKGNPPCIGIGLRKQLSKHFIIAHTPEHNTSKTCAICDHECGPDEIIDKERRETLLAKAKTEDEKKKAKKDTVRGVRRCTNAECACYLPRDYNAAEGIGKRNKRMYQETYVDERNENDICLEHYQCILCEDNDEQ